MNVSNGQDCALYATKDKFIVLPTDEKIQEIREAITQRDVVTLQERSIMNIEVRELRGNLIGLPVALNCLIRIVVHVEE